MNETVGIYYFGANPGYTASLVTYGSDGSVIDRNVTNNDGSHTFIVQGANAVLMASAANDTFVFQCDPQTGATASIGHFDVAHDVLQRSPSAYADVAAALAAISAGLRNAGNPADTWIPLDTLHSVTLTGVAPNTLALHAFLLV